MIEREEKESRHTTICSHCVRPEGYQEDIKASKLAPQNLHPHPILRMESTFLRSTYLTLQPLPMHRDSCTWKWLSLLHMPRRASTLREVENTESVWD